MASDLIDRVVTTLVNNLAGRSSQLLKEDEGALREALQLLGPALICGMVQNGSSTEGAEKLLAVIRSTPFSTGLGDDLSGVIKRRQALGGAASRDSLGESVFRGRISALVDNLATRCALQPASVSHLVEISLVVAFSVLRSRALDDTSGPVHLARILGRQQGDVGLKLDARLASVLEFALPPERVTDVEDAKRPLAPRAAPRAGGARTLAEMLAAQQPADTPATALPAPSGPVNAPGRPDDSRGAPSTGRPAALAAPAAVPNLPAPPDNADVPVTFEMAAIDDESNRDEGPAPNERQSRSNRRRGPRRAPPRRDNRYGWETVSAGPDAAEPEISTRGPAAAGRPSSIELLQQRLGQPATGSLSPQFLRAGRAGDAPGPGGSADGKVPGVTGRVANPVQPGRPQPRRATGRSTSADGAGDVAPESPGQAAKTSERPVARGRGNDDGDPPSGGGGGSGLAGGNPFGASIGILVPGTSDADPVARDNGRARERQTESRSVPHDDPMPAAVPASRSGKSSGKSDGVSRDLAAPGTPAYIAPGTAGHTVRAADLFTKSDEVPSGPVAAPFMRRPLVLPERPIAARDGPTMRPDGGSEIVVPVVPAGDNDAVAPDHVTGVAATATGSTTALATERGPWLFPVSPWQFPTAMGMAGVAAPEIAAVAVAEEAVADTLPPETAIDLIPLTTSDRVEHVLGPDKVAQPHEDPAPILPVPDSLPVVLASPTEATRIATPDWPFPPCVGEEQTLVEAAIAEASQSIYIDRPAGFAPAVPQWAWRDTTPGADHALAFATAGSTDLRVGTPTGEAPQPDDQLVTIRTGTLDAELMTAGAPVDHGAQATHGAGTLNTVMPFHAPKPAGGRTLSRWWLAPALVIAVIVALFVFDYRGTVERRADPTPEPAKQAAVAMRAIPLPGGTSVEAPDSGLVANLASYLGDATQQPGRTLVMEGIEFDRDTARLAPSSEGQIRQIAQVLQAWPKVRIRIDAHVDRGFEGGAPGKMTTERAESVKAALVLAGVPDQRVQARGAASERPIAKGDSPEARARNRRVELTVVER